jgi:hypothetical protein
MPDIVILGGLRGPFRRTVPAGPESCSALTQDLRPGLLSAAPSGAGGPASVELLLDWATGVGFSTHSRSTAADRSVRSTRALSSFARLDGSETRPHTGNPHTSMSWAIIWHGRTSPFPARLLVAELVPGFSVGAVFGFFQVGGEGYVDLVVEGFGWRL